MKRRPGAGKRRPGAGRTNPKQSKKKSRRSKAAQQPVWPAPGSEDTKLGVLMELEVGHGATEVYAGVQALITRCSTSPRSKPRIASFAAGGTKTAMGGPAPPIPRPGRVSLLVVAELFQFRCRAAQAAVSSCSRRRRAASRRSASERRLGGEGSGVGPLYIWPAHNSPTRWLGPLWLHHQRRCYCPRPLRLDGGELVTRVLRFLVCDGAGRLAVETNTRCAFEHAGQIAGRGTIATRRRA
jgi:hypothetical protein